ncbi:hypothetical protein ACIQU3_36705 [Streptomyces sp. NPDC101110]|uniref:hypothetical protein n=1 Tax=Streptomyces sp. NPDC101110 TaxID=3366104 RepID=UPI0037FF11DF
MGDRHGMCIWRVCREFDGLKETHGVRRRQSLGHDRHRGEPRHHARLDADPARVAQPLPVVEFAIEQVRGQLTRIVRCGGAAHVCIDGGQRGHVQSKRRPRGAVFQMLRRRDRVRVGDIIDGREAPHSRSEDCVPLRSAVAQGRQVLLRCRHPGHTQRVLNGVPPRAVRPCQQQPPNPAGRIGPPSQKTVELVVGQPLGVIDQQEVVGRRGCPPTGRLRACRGIGLQDRPAVGQRQLGEVVGQAGFALAAQGPDEMRRVRRRPIPPCPEARDFVLPPREADHTVARGQQLAGRQLPQRRRREWLRRLERTPRVLVTIRRPLRG